MPLSLPEHGRALVVVVDPARVPDAARTCLDPAERETAARFRFPEDATHWTACRAALRHVAGEMLGIRADKVRFKLGPYGKPSLDGLADSPEFNLSHCADLALIAWSRTGAIGIDVEPAARAETLLGCEMAFCHPAELARLPEERGDRATALMKLWTAKEALLKAAGTGMSVDPATIEVGAADRFSAWTVRPLAHPWLKDHLAALAATAEISEVDFVRWAGP